MQYQTKSAHPHRLYAVVTCKSHRPQRATPCQLCGRVDWLKCIYRMDLCRSINTKQTYTACRDAHTTDHRRLYVQIICSIINCIPQYRGEGTVRWFYRHNEMRARCWLEMQLHHQFEMYKTALMVNKAEVNCNIRVEKLQIN